MSISNPLSFKFKQNDLDSNGLKLQKLDTVHRVSVLPVADGTPGIPSHFGAPAGIANYYGFGADGNYYTNGVLGRSWKTKEALDDFADNVTDPVRWTTVGAVPDFSEGGINQMVDLPFGKRLYIEYAGPGAETYDRKGLMVWDGTAGNALSGRVNIPEAEEVGANFEDNCILFGIQEQGNDDDWLFVGYSNTLAAVRTLVFGHVIAGVFTLSGSTPLPIGIQEVDLALEIDPGFATYGGYFNINLDCEDLPLGGWTPINAPVAIPVAFADAGYVPRIHGTFAVGTTPGGRRSLSDLRVENAGVWEGQQRASWHLETLDGTTSGDIADIGVADCPNKLMVCWEREPSGVYASGGNQSALTLIDCTVANDLKMWRRWEGIGPWVDQDGPPKNTSSHYWSPGWMDAAEGHIVMTRNVLSTDGYDSLGEVWLFSLRWDRVIIFTIEPLLQSLLSTETSWRVNRESGTWGARRWALDLPTHISNHDHTHQPAVPFVGTYVNTLVEGMVFSHTYGVSISRCTADGAVKVAYGIQAEVAPGSVGAPAKNCAGILLLGEDPATRAKTRWLVAKDVFTPPIYPLWQNSESIVVVGLNGVNEGSVYWNQHRSDGAHEELEGVLCRKDMVGLPGDNELALAGQPPYVEDTYWEGGGLFIGNGIDLRVFGDGSATSDIVTITTGWQGSSLGHALFYDGTLVPPSLSPVKTYGHLPFPEDVGAAFDESLPGDEFPRWVVNTTTGGLTTPAEVASGWISRAKGHGATTFSTVGSIIPPQAGPQQSFLNPPSAWLQYVHLTGVTVTVPPVVTAIHNVSQRNGNRARGLRHRSRR